MKILVLIFSLLLVNQTETTISANYKGYQDSKYVFIDTYGDEFLFDEVDSKVYDLFDLKESRFINAKFKVTYRMQSFKEGISAELDPNDVSKEHSIEHFVISDLAFDN